MGDSLSLQEKFLNSRWLIASCLASTEAGQTEYEGQKDDAKCF